MKISIKDEDLEYQAIDFAKHMHLISEAKAKANEKYLGFEIPISKDVEMAVEKDMLELKIKLGIYAPELRAYLEYCGWHNYEPWPTN